MKSFAFFIYRPVVTIIPLAIFFSLTFIMCLFLIPIVELITNVYVAAIGILILGVLIVLLTFWVRKKMLIKVVAHLDLDILKISYSGFFYKKKIELIKCTDIYSVKLKKYLGRQEEYKLTIQYGKIKNEKRIFIKVDGRLFGKDDFLDFATAIKKCNYNYI